MEEKKEKFNKVEYDNRYIKENKDRINFVMPKGRKNDIKALEKLIFFEIFDYYGIRKNIDQTFHEEYGTNMLSMPRRNIERRI